MGHLGPIALSSTFVIALWQCGWLFGVLFCHVGDALLDLPRGRRSHLRGRLHSPRQNGRVSQSDQLASDATNLRLGQIFPQTEHECLFTAHARIVLVSAIPERATARSPSRRDARCCCSKADRSPCSPDPGPAEHPAWKTESRSARPNGKC